MPMFSRDHMHSLQYASRPGATLVAVRNIETEDPGRALSDARPDLVSPPRAWDLIERRFCAEH